MRKQVTQTLWTCDYIDCNAESTSSDPADAPSGWSTMSGYLQSPYGGYPVQFDLCSEHGQAFLSTYALGEEDED